MSNQDAGLSRDALIEAVESALIATPGRAVLSADGLAKVPVESFAAIALDAVLRAVADDLDAMYCDAGVSVREENNGYMYGEDLAYLEGVEAAKRRVWGLLGKDGK